MTSCLQAPVGQGTASERVEHVDLRQDGFHQESAGQAVVSGRPLYSFVECRGPTFPIRLPSLSTCLPRCRCPRPPSAFLGFWKTCG